MKDDSTVLVITTVIFIELTVALVVGYAIYQKVQPTIQGLQGDYQGLGGLINLITGKGNSTPAK